MKVLSQNIVRFALWFRLSYNCTDILGTQHFRFLLRWQVMIGETSLFTNIFIIIPIIICQVKICE